MAKAEQAALLATLRARFEANPRRHPGIEWPGVAARLDAAPDRLWSLREMERTGGEPDVVGQPGAAGEFLFMDCSAQSPGGRQSLCYDREALDGRKKFPPKGCATELAASLGAELLTEEQYHWLQQFGSDAFWRRARDPVGAQLAAPSRADQGPPLHKGNGSEMSHANSSGKSSSWLKTPPEVRVLGGALFGDRRFGRVFVYHNGAESYYSGRGFRCGLAV